VAAALDSDKNALAGAMETSFLITTALLEIGAM
jgi:hypothetical protein